MMKIDKETGLEIENEFREISDKLVQLSVKISNVRGKSKMRPYTDKMQRITNELIDIRFDFATMVMEDE